MLNGAGNWKLVRSNNFMALQVIKEALAPQSGCPTGEFGFELHLFDDSLMHFRSHRKYPFLNLTIGDPDSGDALQFERK